MGGGRVLRTLYLRVLRTLYFAGTRSCGPGTFVVIMGGYRVLRTLYFRVFHRVVHRSTRSCGPGTFRPATVPLPHLLHIQPMLSRGTNVDVLTVQQIDRNHQLEGVGVTPPV